jgi:hypothetical protein
MKAYQNLIVSGSINVSGSLLLNGDEVGKGSGNTSVYISGSAPSGSATGSLWFNENDLNMYVRYFDGTSSFWLPVDSNQTLYANSSSYAATASLADVATQARTASYADSFRISGSLTVTGSATFLGTSSFASQTIVNDLQVVNKIQQGNAQKPSVNYGVALGNNTMVSGGYGVAIGNSTFVSASANASFVAGNFNTASAFFQTVVGQFNAPNNTAGAFIVGGGSGTESGSRRNTAVFTTSSIALSGSVSISGSLLLNGAEVGGRGATVTISGSIPSGSANSGSLWWNNVDGNLYIQVVGPTGSTYVPATNTVAGGNYGATYTFETTGSTWNINHNLNTTTPLVTVYSGSSVMIPASITSLDANNTRIIFSGSVAGTAILSTGIGNATTNNAVSASFATTSSHAVTSSFVNTLNQSVIISGSFTVFTGSNVELQVTDTGVKLGNQITDRHQVTGSLLLSGSMIVTGSITASLFGTASSAAAITGTTGSGLWVWSMGTPTNFGWTFSGDASYSGSAASGIILTPNDDFRNGAAYRNAPAGYFTTEEFIFSANMISGGGTGADGIALFAGSNTVSGGAYQGITIFFDEYNGDGVSLDVLKIYRNAALLAAIPVTNYIASGSVLDNNRVRKAEMIVEGPEAGRWLTVTLDDIIMYRANIGSWTPAGTLYGVWGFNGGAYGFHAVPSVSLRPAKMWKMQQGLI